MNTTNLVPPNLRTPQIGLRTRYRQTCVHACWCCVFEIKMACVHHCVYANRVRSPRARALDPSGPFLRARQNAGARVGSERPGITLSLCDATGALE
jgi:hypothetical protein